MEKNIKLTYYQVMIFIKEIDKLKKEDENFSDETSRSFELYVLNRTKEIVLKYPGIVMDFKGILKLYTISDNMYKYLTNLTKVDPLDKKNVSSYIEKIQEEEETRFNELKSKLHR